MIRYSLAIALLIATGISADVSPEIHELLESFGAGWEEKWTQRHFTGIRNRFRIVQENGNFALRIDSHRSASGVWRSLEVNPVHSGTISWRWKVEKSLSMNRRETDKAGDDFAARVFVVFEPHFLRWKTKSICYVWAGNESPGNIFESPYSSSVGTIVLQSGDAHAGQWIMEERDFVSDYRSFFGNDPERISAVALMVDTDNTGGRTRAWFDDVFVVVNTGGGTAETNRDQ